MAFDVVGLDTMGLWTGNGWNTDEDEEFPVFAAAYGRRPNEIRSKDSFSVKGENYLREDQE